MDTGIDRGAALERFSGTIPFRTVSGPGDFDLAPFGAIHDYLADTWPILHREADRETVSGGSLLYTIPGTDRSLAPALLTAHLDVVPVEDPDDPLWVRPPWSGLIADGRVWGRGTLDFKSGLAGILEACQLLLAGGFRPVRTVLLAFGHDEETGGTRGARAIVDLLAGRGVDRVEYVVDEGGYVYSFPWMDGETALIGLAEKGYVTVEISATGEQGHSSRPAARTPVGLVAEAVALLEKEGMPLRLCPPVETMMLETRDRFRYWSGISPEGCAGHIASWPEGNALVRSTIAPTMATGSSRENIIPARASTLVNFRIIPGETIGEVLDRASAILSGLPVEQTVLQDSMAEPSPVSPSGTEVYRRITGILGRLLPDAVVAPGIFVASTDSKHYGALTDLVYRIQPVVLGPAGMASLHTEGESIGVDDYIRCIEFYAGLLEETCG